MLRPCVRWLLTLAWMGLIFLLSAQPDLPHAHDPWLDTLLKKAAHASVYGVLAGLYVWALRGKQPASDQLRLLSLALTLAYAASDEFHQSLVPGRHPSATDFLIDATGATLALLLERWRSRSPR